MRNLIEIETKSVSGCGALGAAIGAVTGAIVGGIAVAAADGVAGGAATIMAIGIVGMASRTGEEIGAAL